MLPLSSPKVKMTPRKSWSIVENGERKNEARDEHEEESEGEEEEDMQAVQPIDPRVIDVLDVLVEERQEDAVRQRAAMEFLNELQKFIMMWQERYMQYLA